MTRATLDTNPAVRRARCRTGEDGKRERISVALNFEGAAVPDWVELIPAGDVVGIDGRRWVNDEPDAIVSAFEARGSDMVFDFEHQSDFGMMTPAAGWITGVENRGGAIWGRVEWTEKAREMIAAREYRYVSPVFFYLAELPHRIVALDSAALTHNPNLSLKALNARRSDAAVERDQTPRTEGPVMKDAQRKALCRKLGLAEEASDEAILAAVEEKDGEINKARNAAEQPDLTKFVPRSDYDKVKGDLESARNAAKKRADEDAEAAVDAAIADGKITPASRDYHLAACKADRASFDAFVAGTGRVAATEGSGLDGKTPGDGSKLDAEEKAVCRQLGVSEEDFLKTKAAAA